MIKIRDFAGCLGVCVLLFVAPPLGAQLPNAADAALVQNAPSDFTPPPLELSKSLDSLPLGILARADYEVPDKIIQMNEWNAKGRLPTQIGFVRLLESAPLVVLSEGSTEVPGIVRKTQDAVVWAGRIEVERAYRLRLHLSEVRLPANAELWVQGDRGTAAHFGLGLLRQEGDLWTPSVAGEVIHIQVRIPSRSMIWEDASFRIDSVAQIFRPDPDEAISPKGIECLQDAACFSDPMLDTYKEAVAQLSFVTDGKVGLCSGALVNDLDDSGFIPYLLTANHCFATQSEASTLEARFDFIATSCLGPSPSVIDLPIVTGATLLATSPSTDSTFVQLSHNPSGATAYLGWDTSPVQSGTDLFRLSHPAPQGIALTMGLSATRVYDPLLSCSGRPTSRYIYSFPVLGTTVGGSSGAPTVDSDNRIRGQLLGQCFINGGDATNLCNSFNDQVDGRFSGFFNSIQQYLDPARQVGCSPSETVACLTDGRFRVTVVWEDPAGHTGPGYFAALNSVTGSDRTGSFWFFGQANIEVIVKVLPYKPTGSYWVFASALTTLKYTISVTDTVTGVTKKYTNPQGKPAVAVADTTGFEP